MTRLENVLNSGWDCLQMKTNIINVRRKGAAGEREFCSWLKRTLKLKTLPTRNLEQVRSGGADVIDIPPFVFEVKRCEQVFLPTWWAQVCTASNRGDIPVVAYRKNRKPWRFLISAKWIGLERGFIRLEEKIFSEWIKTKFI